MNIKTKSKVLEEEFTVKGTFLEGVIEAQRRNSEEFLAFMSAAMDGYEPRTQEDVGVYVRKLTMKFLKDSNRKARKARKASEKE